MSVTAHRSSCFICVPPRQLHTCHAHCRFAALECTGACFAVVGVGSHVRRLALRDLPRCRLHRPEVWPSEGLLDGVRGTLLQSWFDSCVGCGCRLVWVRGRPQSHVLLSAETLLSVHVLFSAETLLSLQFYQQFSAETLLSVHALISADTLLSLPRYQQLF